MAKNQKNKIKKFLSVRNHGFFRAAVVVPRVFLSDTKKNAEEHLRELKNVYDQGAAYAVCPELGLTGYSNSDLFFSDTLLEGARDSLKYMARKTASWNMLITVGLPMVSGGKLFNVAATFFHGKVLAIVPKNYPPEYREFYELRHFRPGREMTEHAIDFFGQEVPCGDDILIKSKKFPDFILHTEICEDLWAPIPPSAVGALAGATVLANLSASNITVGKSEYRENLVVGSSAKNLAVQLYTAAGYGESTTDLAWDGDGYIAERGQLLKRTERFNRKSSHIIADVDLNSLVADRMRQNSFSQNAYDHRRDFRAVVFKGDIGSDEKSSRLERAIDPHPFVPKNPKKIDERCREIFMIQATSLVRRLEALPEGRRKVVIGVSGGQDSTIALFVAAHAMDLMGVSRKNIIAITMPGFGTDKSGYDNACELIKAIGATFVETSIKDLSALLFEKIGHDPNVHDVTFQNVQAWARKFIELAAASEKGGMDLGTGDLSESMLGWSTMFADHASHYNVNASVPKTLVSFLIKWAAKVIFSEDERLKRALNKILREIISPGLLPLKKGKVAQKTEEIIGPYELHDFTGYYFIRFGFSPSKIARMALHAFGGKYAVGEIKKWLKVFLIRFFDNQYKRSCMPDGPKVGSVSVSPRGDWRMPSDASPRIWLDDLAEVPEKI
ncbi:MAG: NAD(+) synthase [Patescibacteria group bacterium]